MVLPMREPTFNASLSHFEHWASAKQLTVIFSHMNGQFVLMLHALASSHIGEDLSVEAHAMNSNQNLLDAVLCVSSHVSATDVASDAHHSDVLSHESSRLSEAIGQLGLLHTC